MSVAFRVRNSVVVHLVTRNNYIRIENCLTMKIRNSVDARIVTVSLFIRSKNPKRTINKTMSKHEFQVLIFYYESRSFEDGKTKISLPILKYRFGKFAIFVCVFGQISVTNSA